MTEPKFTPGPWHEMDTEDASGIRIVAGQYETEVLIAYCPYPEAADYIDNPRLIAAAPELYEALGEFVRPYEHDLDAGLIRGTDWIRRARAALAKARGET